MIQQLLFAPTDLAGFSPFLVINGGSSHLVGKRINSWALQFGGGALGLVIFPIRTLPAPENEARVRTIMREKVESTWQESQKERA